MTSTLDRPAVGLDDGRRRTARPEMHLPECGTITGYNKGCGCVPCRDASAAARRGQRAAIRTGVPRAEIQLPPPPTTAMERRRKERPELNLPECGTVRGYAKGCGCGPCREAKAAQRRDYYARTSTKPKRKQGNIPNVLSADVLARLRAREACRGCGATRQERADGKTTIRHQKGCPTARNREGKL